MSKYLVLKREDLSWLSERERDIFFEALEKIDNSRKRNNKLQNKYLVLNIDDTFSMPHLNAQIQDIITKRMHNAMFEKMVNIPLKIKDIAVILVNAILKTKGKVKL